MVFGIFKKKPDKVNKAVESISALLDIQLSLCDWNAHKLSTDNWALGYIFGFHDAFLQALQINDQDKSLLVFMGSYERLFDQTGMASELFRQSLGLQKENRFKTGMLEGGKEAMKFLGDQTPCLGLAKRLQRGSENR